MRLRYRVLYAFKVLTPTCGTVSFPLLCTVLIVEGVTVIGDNVKRVLVGLGRMKERKRRVGGS